MTQAECSSKYDVNCRNAAFWDTHMTINVLQWLKTEKAYESESLNLALNHLLNKTLLVDYYESLTGKQPPESYMSRASEMKNTFIELERRLEGFLSCMVTAGRQRQELGVVIERRTIKEWQDYWSAHLSQKDEESDTKNLQSIVVEFPEDVLSLLLQYCQLFYAFGDHAVCKRRLIFYLDHVCEFTTEARENTTLKLQCLWGLAASMILTLPTPEKIKEESMAGDSMEIISGDDSYLIPKYFLMIENLLESSKLPREHVVLSKLWLFQWSIWSLLRFYFLKTYKAGFIGTMNVSRNQQIPFHIEWSHLLDWIFSDQMLSLISSMCPQLLRYVAVIIILNRQRQDHFKSAIDAISRAVFRYSDLLTSILDSLFVKYNFEEAQEKLALCKQEAASDFLLKPLKETIEEHARLLIFQTYCRIQKSIDIDTIAKKLHMTSDTAERWIVNLIRHARLEAKIDSERNCVEIASSSTSVYQQVLEKTRNILVRMSVLIQSLDRYSGESTTTNTFQRGGGDFYKSRGLNTSTVRNNMLTT